MTAVKPYEIQDARGTTMNQFARFWSARPASPGFLIHDSTIFDGVDERHPCEAKEHGFNSNLSGIVGGP